MASRKTYHVTPKAGKGWAVTSEGAKRAVTIHDTKQEAVDRSKQLAKKQPLGQVVIHGRDGRIQTEHTYGKDPYPPEG